MAAKRPDRVAQRPDPGAWGEDELMTLGEAARLHWPDGPITERTLRTAVRDGRLPISRFARKIFVTKRALKALSHCAAISPSSPRRGLDGAGRGFERDLAAIRRMGRG
ncbi:hypothetical protein ABIA00_004566 [Bradyrhizobium ottawaense]